MRLSHALGFLSLCTIDMVGWIILWGCGMSSVLQNVLQHPWLPPLETSSAPPAITTAKMLPSVLYRQNHHRVKTCHIPCQLHTFSNNTHKLNHIIVGRWQLSRGIRGYLLSCVCHNKWSQICWLQTTEIYSLTVLSSASKRPCLITTWSPAGLFWGFYRRKKMLFLKENHLRLTILPSSEDILIMQNI